MKNKGSECTVLWDQRKHHIIKFQMTVFNMNKADELDLAILSVLLKAQAGGDEQQRLSQLKLALTWDRVDIAQEEIFREDILWRQGRLCFYVHPPKKTTSFWGSVGVTKQSVGWSCEKVC